MSKRPQFEGKPLGMTVEVAAEYLRITTIEVSLLVKENRIRPYKSTDRVGAQCSVGGHCTTLQPRSGRRRQIRANPSGDEIEMSRP
jgi:hypothetical protein